MNIFKNTASRMLFKVFIKLLIIGMACEIATHYFLNITELNSPMIRNFIDILVPPILTGFISWYFIIQLELVPFLSLTQNVPDTYNRLIQALSKNSIISITDKSGKIIFVNDKFCEISGYTKDELVGKDHRILNSGYHTKEFFEYFYEQILSGKTWIGEVCNRSKSGESYWVESIVIPTYDLTGEISQFLSIRIDITSKKIAEELIKNESINRLHRERMSMLGEMSSGIAHEINNPLAVINLNLDKIHKQLKNNTLEPQEIEQIKDRILKSQNQIFRIKKIISALREFSRDENVKIEDRTTISKIVDVTLALINEKIKSQNIDLRLDIISDTEIKVNQVQIEQVLVNLIANSVDAIEALPDKWIEVKAREDENYLEINITDSGQGIPNVLKEKIMKPFFTTKNIGKGTGLGLSISKSIIEQHCGVIFIDHNCPNTRFTIKLPLNINGAINTYDLDEAIRSHLNWRQLFMSKISNGIKDVDLKELSCPDKCDLGKWIKRVEQIEPNEKILIELKKAHATFHECAGEIATRIIRDGSSISSLEINSGTKFDEKSKKLLYFIKKIKNISNKIKNKVS